MSRWIRLTTVVLAWVACAAPIGAVEVGSAETGATRPAAGQAVHDDLESLLEGMTPEQLQKLIQEAMVARLGVERKQVAIEIREDRLYLPEGIGKALSVLEDKPLNTQKDNIDRICRAFAAVDEEFAEIHGLRGEGKHTQAAAKARQIVDKRDATYLSAAKHYLYAESLMQCDRHEEAVEVYTDVLVNMPEKISFAATAAVRAAEAWEKQSRGAYAMKMYEYCLVNYGLTLEPAEAQKIIDKIDHYEKIYKDPLGAVARKMGGVTGRLMKEDTGTATQKQQSEIVSLLEDLIQMAEEQQKGGGQGQQDQQQQQQEQKDQQGGGEQPSAASGDPSGNNPSNPAANSTLVPGKTARPSNLAKERPGADGSDWATLPPRQKEKLRSLMDRATPEAYREISKEYHKKLAEDGGD